MSGEMLSIFFMRAFVANFAYGLSESKMRCHSPFARAIITALLKVSGMWEIMHGMILPVTHDERWNDGITELEGAYSVAADKAADLMINYDGYLHGKCPLSTLLDRDFE